MGVHKNALKMYMFCIHWLFGLFEKDQQQQQQQQQAGSVRSRRGNNTRSRRKAAMSGSEAKERILKVIVSTLEQEGLGRLWNSSRPEERFVNLFFGVAFTLVENADNMKQKTIREYTLLLIHAALNVSADNSNAVAAVINLVMKQEQAIPFVAELFSFVFQESRSINADNDGGAGVSVSGTTFINDVFTEIGKLDGADFQNDSAGARNLSSFIMQVSDELPQCILANISIIIQHLNNESYNVRSAILHALSRVIHKILVQGGRSDEDSRKTRDQLLDIMQERFRDVNAFTRGKNIQCWTYLYENKSIPVKRLESVVELVIQRMTDKGVYVRRAALQFMISLTRGNPYAATLRRTYFLRQKELVDQKLGELQDEQVRSATSEQESNIVDGAMFASVEQETTMPDNNDASDLVQSESTSQLQQLLQIGNPAVSEEAVNLLKYKAYVVGALKIITLIEDAIQIAIMLLQSKTNQDVIECIQLFVIAHAAQVEASDEGIKRMMRLIWSREQSVRQAVVDAFSEAYLFGTRMDSPQTCCEVVTKITELVKSCTITELRALEAIIVQCTRKDNISKDQEIEVIVRTLWSIYKLQDELSQIKEISEEDSEAAAILLSMIAKSRPELIRKRFKTMIKFGLGHRGAARECLARYTCDLLASVAGGIGSPIPSQEQLDVGSMPLRFDPDSTAIKRIVELIIGDSFTIHSWITFAGPALDSIFSLCTDPIVVSQKIIKYFASRLSIPNPTNVQQEANENSNMEDDTEEVGSEQQQEQGQRVSISTTSLTKLLFTLGHCSFRELVFVEGQYNEAKLRRQAAIDAQLSTPRAAKTRKKRKSTRRTVAGKRGRKVVVMASGDEEENEMTEEAVDQTAQELGMDASTVDEHELDEEFEQRERNILAEGSIYHSYAMLVLQVCTDQEQRFMDTMLKKCAILTLCKFMIVSQDFCEKYLRVLFTLLETRVTKHDESNSIIKSNIIVSVGDMTCRFPNTVEPWMHRLYSCVYDQDVRVRKHVLMVLTHLVLNDMTKMKSNVADIVRCIEDDDEEIRNLAKSFFSELACKSSGNNNPIYNLLPEILSRLADDKTLSEESYRNIMQYLLGFITKDRHTEKLVERLCQRFGAIDRDVALWQDIAFCLSMLNINDKCIRRIIDGFKFYQHALVDEEVYETFMQIGNKFSKKAPAAKGTGANATIGAALDIKQALEEWQSKLSETHNRLKEDQFTVEKLVKSRTQRRNKRHLTGLDLEVEEEENNEDPTISAEGNEQTDQRNGLTESQSSYVAQNEAQTPARHGSRGRGRGSSSAKTATRGSRARGTARKSRKKAARIDSSSEESSWDMELDSESGDNQEGTHRSNNEGDMPRTRKRDAAARGRRAPSESEEEDEENWEDMSIKKGVQRPKGRRARIIEDSDDDSDYQE